MRLRGSGVTLNGPGYVVSRFYFKYINSKYPEVS